MAGKRRLAGEVVYVRPGAGYGGYCGNDPFVVMGEEHPMPCPLDAIAMCDDPACVERTLRSASGDRYLHHVSECEMGDSPFSVTDPEAGPVLAEPVVAEPRPYIFEQHNAEQAAAILRWCSATLGDLLLGLNYASTPKMAALMLRKALESAAPAACPKMPGEG